MRFFKYLGKRLFSVAEIIAIAMTWVLIIAVGLLVVWLFIVLIEGLGGTFLGIVKAIMLEGLTITFYVTIVLGFLDALENVRQDRIDKANGYDYTDHIY